MDSDDSIKVSANRYHQLEDDIASYVEYALPAGHHIEVGIFQSAQMVLVAHICQVIHNQGQFSDFPAFDQDIRSC